MSEENLDNNKLRSDMEKLRQEMQDYTPFTIISPEEMEKRSSQHGVIAHYGGSREKAYGGHLTYASFQINGKDFFNDSTVEFTLKQSVYTHHEFELVCDPSAFSERKEYLLLNSRQYLGSRLYVSFNQFGTAASHFTGIITQIASRQKDGASHVILRGRSPGFLLENGENNRSFENQTLEQIIKKVLTPYPQDLMNFDINPSCKDALPYIVQGEESDFEFLNRLCRRYGEYFFYNGEMFRVSYTGGRRIEMMEGQDVFDYELQIEAAPQHFTYTAYDPRNSESYRLSSKDEKIQDSENPYQRFAQESSLNLFTEPASSLSSILSSRGKTDLRRAVTIEKRKRMNQATLKATSSNPNLRVGDAIVLSVWKPGNSMFKNGVMPAESYKITEIQHYFIDGEGYHNSFTGVPRDSFTPADSDVRDYPKAQLQHAEVTDNKDPEKMGRVRVQFVWQQEDNQQTPWIQIVQPHAGSGKGTYINPEIGETVLVAFQGGNAEAPVVLGTAYNGGEIAEYYTEGNDIKVIQTRSGTRIVFNDAEGSILITDPSGNSWFMDGQGNIKVDAPKNIEMNAGEDFNVTVGNDLNIDVQNNKTENIAKNYMQNTQNTFTVIRSDKTEDVGESYRHQSGESNMLTTKGNMKLRGTILTIVQGGKDVEINIG